MVGTPVGRTAAGAEIEGLIGFFVNTLALRVDLSGAPDRRASCWRGCGARRWRRSSTRTCRSSRWWSCCSRRAAWRTRPLFQVMFALQNAPRGARWRCRGWRLGARGAPDARRRPSSTCRSRLRRGGRAHRGRAWTYATDLFDAATVERLAGPPARAAGGDGRPTTRRPSTQLPLLPDERARAGGGGVERDGRRRTRRDACVHELFEAQAARTPDAVAVVFEGEALTLRRAERAGQPAGAPPARAGRGPGRARGRSAWSARWRWWWRCWACSRRAARTCRSTRRTRPSGWRFMLADSAPRRCC